MKVKEKEKTKEQLLKELTEARQRITQLETSETERNQAEEERVEAFRMAADVMENMLYRVTIADMRWILPIAASVLFCYEIKKGGGGR